MLPARNIVLRLGGEDVTLSPTLRAAWRLEKEHGGFDCLFRKIADGDFGAAVSVLAEFTSQPSLADHVWSFGLDKLRAPLMTFVVTLAGSNDDKQASDTANDNGPAMSFADYHARLFRIGTGWLGWTPAETWNATPAEIVEAYRGRTEMLRAIFGGAEAAPSAPTLSLAEKFRAAFSTFGTKKVARGT